MEPSDALQTSFAQLAGELEDARGQLAACAALINRLNSELEARTRELNATGDVLKVISRSAFDLQTVLNTLTESAARLCGADTAIIRRREGDAYPVAATYGLTEKQRDHFAIYPTSPSRESVFGRAVMECRTIHVPDVLADPEYKRPQLQNFVAVRAMLGVPLVRDGVPVGVFTLQRRDPQPYSQQQIDLVTTFADQALIAIENVRLFEELKARTSEAQESLEYQTATSDVLNVISRSPTEIQPVLDTIVQTAAQLCDAKRAFIYRYDGAVLRHQASHNASPELKEFVTRNPISPGRHSGVARAAFEKCTIHISDVRSDPEYTFGAAQVDPIRTVLAVPMLKASDLVGVLVIYRLEVRPFTRRQIELVTTFADQAVIAIENARLFEEVQARTAELQESLDYQTATSDVLNVISRSPSQIQPVLDAIVAIAGRLCEAHDATILLRDGDKLEVTAHRGPIPITIDLPVGRGWVAGRAALDREPVHVHDLSAAVDEFPDGQAMALRDGHRTTLATPLLRENVAIGALLIRRTEVRPFSEKQIAVLQTFADQAVIAIENVRLFEEVQARTAELQESLEYQTATSEVLGVISRAPSQLQPVFDVIVKTAARLCKADYAAVHQLRDGKFHVRAVNNAEAEYAKYLRENPMPLDGGSVVGRTALEGRTVHLPDCLADPSYIRLGYQRTGGFRTILGVPLLREGVAIGVITMLRNEVRPFTDKQIELLQTFADQAVIAIENVRLFEEVQARTAELLESLEYQTATSDVLNVISRSPSQIQPVLDAIVAIAGRLCDAHDTIIFLREVDALKVVAHVGSIPLDFERLPIQPGAVAGRAVIEGKPIHVQDVLARAEEFPEGEAMGSRLGYRTILAMPLIRENVAIGAIIIRRAEVRPFSENQISLLQTFADQAVIAINNVCLFEEVQARTRELQESLEYQTATSDVLNVISRAPSQLQPVFDAIVETAAHLCEAEYALVYRLEGGEYHVAATNNADEEFVRYAREHPLAPGRGSLIGRTALEGCTIHLPDCLSDPEYTVLEYQKVGKYRSTLGVPLVRDGVTIGVIAMMRSIVKPFSDKQIQLVETFADQAVIAIENVRLFEEVQARTEDLSEALQQQTATADVLKVISRSTFDLQTVLDTLVQSAARLCDADSATIAQQRGQQYYRTAVYGFSSQATNYLKDSPVEWERGSGTGRTLIEAKVVHIPDVEADPEYTWTGAKEVGRFRAMLGVPLLRKGTPIGALVLTRERAEPFTDKQIDLATTFADQAVIAIENVRLFEEVQARTRELQESLEYQTATSEVLNVISRSPSDLEPVLDAVGENAARLCEATNAVIFRLDGDMLRQVASYGPTPATSQELHVNRARVVTRSVFDRQTIHVHDLQAEVDEFPEGSAHARRAGHHTTLATPLLREGTPIGAILIRRLEVRPFSERQIKLLETFADQAVIAIENVRLFEEVQARTEELAKSVGELRALGEVSQAVNSTLDLETVLSTIVAKAVQLSTTEAGAIYVFSKLRQRFRLRATYGMSEAMIAEIEKQSVGLGESYIGKAAAGGEAVQVPDLTTEPPSPIRDLVLTAGYRALLVVPLLRPGRVVGALVVRRKEPGLFPGSTIDLLQTFAAQSVLAIQNARLFEDVEARTRELAKSLEELRAAQERLIQTEKLASLGQLTAGIAHEIKNPLNFVNNFAALSIELIGELKDVIRSAPQDEEQTAELMELLAGNLGKVVQHGKRADSIVKNMLLHSRAGSGERRVANINALVEESLNLAYHGARAEKQGFNVTIERSLDPFAGEVDVLPQEITRVFLNLISNGFYATVKRKERTTGPYEPTLFAATRNLGEQVEIRIRDNGTGVPPEVREKMFDPFFTTKPAGEGTGLGLSLSHDIVVKQHRGSIEVDTSPGEYTEFRIVLPRSTTSPANDEVRQ